MGDRPLTEGAVSMPIDEICVYRGYRAELRKLVDDLKGALILTRTSHNKLRVYTFFATQSARIAREKIDEIMKKVSIRVSICDARRFSRPHVRELLETGVLVGAARHLPSSCDLLRRCAMRGAEGEVRLGAGGLPVRVRESAPGQQPQRLAEFGRGAEQSGADVTSAQRMEKKTELA